ncbi:hypothetical protein [Campylobacter portucalensis]|nr:hypothetical protein [Campylobacter portucalensis]
MTFLSLKPKNSFVPLHKPLISSPINSFAPLMAPPTPPAILL